MQPSHPWSIAPFSAGAEKRAACPKATDDAAGPASWPSIPQRHSEIEALLANLEKARTPHGFGTLDANLELDPAAGTQLWITCRMTHIAALASLMGAPEAAPFVRHGVGALSGSLADYTHPGWFSVVPNAEDVPGPWSTNKEAYAHAFVLLASSSAHRAAMVAAERQKKADPAGVSSAEAIVDQAKRIQDRALSVLFGQLWDADYGRVIDTASRDFSEVEEYRGVNANMHFTEALLAAYDDISLYAPERAEKLLATAVGILEFVVRDSAPALNWHIPEHFDTNWKVLPDYNRDQPAHPFRPYGYTIGHSFEWARLSLHAWAALRAAGKESGAQAGANAEPNTQTGALAEAPDWMVDNAISLTEAAIAEGWNADGEPGFVYTIDDDAAPVVRARMHWVVCEALAVLSALITLGREGHPSVTSEMVERYQQLCTQWWEYTRNFIIEKPGAWYHELNEKNQPAGGTWSGKPDIYHAVQALLVPDLPLTPTFAGALSLYAQE